MKKDLILFNGNIYTMNFLKPKVNALLVRKEKIIAIGNNAEIKSKANSKYESIDLNGKVVLPGFIDSHVHLLGYAKSLIGIDLSNTKSKEEVIEKVKTRVEKTEPNVWILGYGWNENDWKEFKLPSKADLDKVCNKNPLVLFKKDGHSIWVNSVALKKADINEHTLDLSGGKIVRESISKTPTGILKENAIYLVLKKIKKENIEDILPTPVLNSSTTSKEIKIKNMGNIYSAVKTASKNFNKVGITSVHNMESMNRQKILFDLNSEGELNLRIYSFFEQIEPEDLYHFKRSTKLDNRWTKIGGIKLFYDGSLGSRTAYMIEPYNDDENNYGIKVMEKQEVGRLMRSANQLGLNFAMHAIGDRANKEVLDIYGRVLKNYENETVLRNRIEHVQILRREDFVRFKKLNLIASMQPYHLASDMKMAEKGWGKRCKWSYAWDKLVKNGVHMTFGSDCPVETINPIRDLYVSITRRKEDGYPDGSWYPEHKLTLKRAIYSYTFEGA
ncbi:MAG: amidohydrolase, partial [Actinobacteria bacterium]|nr:amidohydrolase [Actinomycetota bacterium]